MQARLVRGWWEAGMGMVWRTQPVPKHGVAWSGANPPRECLIRYQLLAEHYLITMASSVGSIIGTTTIPPYVLCQASGLSSGLFPGHSSLLAGLVLTIPQLMREIRQQNPYKVSSPRSPSNLIGVSDVSFVMAWTLVTDKPHAYARQIESRDPCECSPSLHPVLVSPPSTTPIHSETTTVQQ